MKTYCFSDLHGNYKLWEMIKNYCKPDDKLIFLGDACDRGPDSIKIMQEMFNDKRVIYLLGNHEEMLIDYYNKGLQNSLLIYKNLIDVNESNKTINDFINLPIDEKQKLISDLQYKTNKFYIYINKDKKNLFLSHAGTDFASLSQPLSKDLLWNRDHIDQDVYNNKYKYWYIIHGHTPVQGLQPDKTIPEIYRYCNNHKIDIDLGSFQSNKIALLDLDTLQVKYFKIEEEQKDDTRDTNEKI